MVSLVLASASPARLSTLRSAGIRPDVLVSGVDEPAVLADAARHQGGELSPAEAVLVLARAKCEAVARTLDDAADNPGAPGGPPSPGGPAHLSSRAAADPVSPGDLVLGCDSLLDLDGDALGKPADADDAVRRWRRMRGRSGVLHTGHWLVDRREPRDRHGAGSPGPEGRGATSSTVVHFADVSDAEIAAYVATGEPLVVAGAFTIDGLGGAFVTGIEGDHHGVVGLSLPLLRDMLAGIGLSVPDLWETTT